MAWSRDADGIIGTHRVAVRVAPRRDFARLKTRALLVSRPVGPHPTDLRRRGNTKLSKPAAEIPVVPVHLHLARQGRSTDAPRIVQALPEAGMLRAMGPSFVPIISHSVAYVSMPCTVDTYLTDKLGRVSMA